MCVFPKTPKVPVTPERQAIQTPQDAVANRASANARRRRGFWSTIMTSPQGAPGKPKVTGASGTTGSTGY